MERKKENVAYLLPKPGFFARGFRGSVVHALGIADGLKKLGGNYKIFLRGDLETDLLSGHNYQVTRGFVGTLKSVKSYLKIEDAPGTLITRYAFSKLFYIALLYALVPGNTRKILEVNTFQANYIRNKTLSRILLYIELAVLGGDLTIYVVSPGLKKLIESTRFKRKVIVVPNGHSLESRLGRKTSTEEFKLKRVKYFGSLHPYYDFQVVLQALKDYNATAGHRVEFWFYGNMNDQQVSEFSEFGNFQYKGKFDNRTIFDNMDPSGDALVLPYRKNSIAEYGFPTKLSEYLVSGCLVISSKTGVLGTLLSENNAYLYDSDDRTALVGILKEIAGLSDPDYLLQQSEANNQLAEDLLWVNLVEGLINERSFEKK